MVFVSFTNQSYTKPGSPLAHRVILCSCCSTHGPTGSKRSFERARLGRVVASGKRRLYQTWIDRVGCLTKQKYQLYTFWCSSNTVYNLLYGTVALWLASDIVLTVTRRVDAFDSNVGRERRFKNPDDSRTSKEWKIRISAGKKIVARPDKTCRRQK